MKKEAKLLKQKRIDECKNQRTDKPLDYELWVAIIYYHGSHIRRDIDNYAKLVLDSMTGIVFEDDSQIKHLFLTKEYDKSNPRVCISVYSLENKNNLDILHMHSLQTWKP